MAERARRGEQHYPLVGRIFGGFDDEIISRILPKALAGKVPDKDLQLETYRRIIDGQKVREVSPPWLNVDGLEGVVLNLNRKELWTECCRQWVGQNPERLKLLIETPAFSGAKGDLDRIGEKISETNRHLYVVGLMQIATAAALGPSFKDVIKVIDVHSSTRAARYIAAGYEGAASSPQEFVERLIELTDEGAGRESAQAILEDAYAFRIVHFLKEGERVASIPFYKDPDTEEKIADLYQADTIRDGFCPAQGLTGRVLTQWGRLLRKPGVRTNFIFQITNFT